MPNARSGPPARNTWRSRLAHVAAHTSTTPLGVHAAARTAAASTSESIDFSRTFLTFRIDTMKKETLTSGHSRRADEAREFTLNNARIPIECIADVTHVASGSSQRIAMGASCKTEACFVKGDIWRGAAEGLSADFVPIGSLDADAWLVIKTYDTVGKTVPISAGPQAGQPQPDRQLLKASEALDTLRIDVQRHPATEQPDAETLIAAGLHNTVFVCRTAYSTSDGAYDIVLHYPCKTVNLNEREVVYQPDTGPVLFFPTLSAATAPGDVVATAELAYVAWNGNFPGFAEFLVRAPAEVAPGVFTQHYCESVRVEPAKNAMYALIH